MSTLPRWAEIGGFLLALLAGYVNATGLLGFSHEAVSHVTGTTTLLGAQLARGDWLAVSHLLLILISFMLGAAGSGFFISHASLKLGRQYGGALCIEGVLLILAMLLLEQGAKAGHYLASAACGLQNGMVTTFSGATVRTTHMTGLFTDLGIMLGAKLRGQSGDRRKVVMFLLLIAGFVVGGALGSVAFGLWAFRALLGPIGLAFGLAAAYWIYLWRLAHKASVDNSSP